MLDATASQAAKEQGMQIALDFAGDDWRARVLVELRAWIEQQRAAGRTEVTMEQFRAVAKAQPPRPQAWGALVKPALKAGLMEMARHADGSPVIRAAESVKTHGHFVRVYWITGTRSPSEHDRAPSQAQRRPSGLAHVGAVWPSIAQEGA